LASLYLSYVEQTQVLLKNPTFCRAPFDGLPSSLRAPKATATNTLFRGIQRAEVPTVIASLIMGATTERRTYTTDILSYGEFHDALTLVNLELAQNKRDLFNIQIHNENTFDYSKHKSTTLLESKVKNQIIIRQIIETKEKLYNIDYYDN
jgi:hypothetical protein